jgi:hypothetical protein
MFDGEPKSGVRFGQGLKANRQCGTDATPVETEYGPDTFEA